MKSKSLGLSTKEKDAGSLRPLIYSAPTPGSVVDHGSLLGLGDDDHSQYVHISAARTITAQHDFAPASAQAPFTLGVNAQGQLVVGLNADKLDGYHLDQDVSKGESPTWVGITLSNEGLHLLDSNATHDLIIKPGSNLTLDRILTIATGDFARTITLSGDPTLGDWFDQAVKQASSPTFAGVTLGNTGLHVLDTNLSHDLIIKPGSDLTGDKTLTLTTGDASREITLEGNPTLSNWFDQGVRQGDSPEFAGLMLAGHLLPTVTDAYDIGSAADLFRSAYISEMHALLFVEDEITIHGGWFVVGHDQGTLEADVGAGNSTVDFGKAMVPNDFVLIRAEETGGSPAVEYIKVLTLVSGTTYNVTRNLDGSGANNWSEGVPFLVLGASGDGRIEIVANSTEAPNISILEQGVAYNASTERVRIGNMRNAFGVGASNYWGLGVGDYSGGNYLKYDSDGGFEIQVGGGAVLMDSGGLSIALDTTWSQLRSYSFDYGGTDYGGLYGFRDPGSTTNSLAIWQQPKDNYDSNITIYASAVGGDAEVTLQAYDVLDNAILYVRADGGSSRISMYADRVGIGIDPTDGWGLHIYQSAGGVAANSESGIVVERTGNSYINFLGGTSSVQGILFGDTDADRGGLCYYHATDYMDFRVAAGNRMRLFEDHLRMYDPIKMLESAAAIADTASYGQWWVKNTTPNRGMFTADNGWDYDLIYGGWVAMPAYNYVTAPYSATCTPYNLTVTDTTMKVKEWVIGFYTPDDQDAGNHWTITLRTMNITTKTTIAQVGTAGYVHGNWQRYKTTSVNAAMTGIENLVIEVTPTGSPGYLYISGPVVFMGPS